MYNAPLIRSVASRLHKRFYRRMSVVACYRGLATLPPAILEHAAAVLMAFADALFVNARTRFRFTLAVFMDEARERGLDLAPSHLLLMQHYYKIMKNKSPVFQVYIMHLTANMPAVTHYVRDYYYYWLFTIVRKEENPTIEDFRLAVKRDPHLVGHFRWMSHVHRLARVCLNQELCDSLFANIPMDEEELLTYWREDRAKVPYYFSDNESENDETYDSDNDAMDVDTE